MTMTFRSLSTLAGLALALALVLVLAGTAAAPAYAEEVAWRLEQPSPPKSPPGVPESGIPIGLGNVGDVEFSAPNRGLLITAGNPPTIPPGVWAYNGVDWHELASVCGATDGRIAWGGPGEFWTVSDGRPGQASESAENINKTPPLQDNTLCHFAGGRVVASYAHPAFQADSYQAMHAAGCFPPAPPAVVSTDCWFAGDALEAPQVGAFQLHWNGGSLEPEPYTAEGHPVEDMRLLGGHIYESVRLAAGDRSSAPEPPLVHRIEPEGMLPTFEAETLPFFEPTLDFLRLSGAEEALWGAAGPQNANETKAPPVTVVRRYEGSWSELIGPSNPLGTHVIPEEETLFPEGAEHATVSSIAADPGTESAWIALAPQVQHSGEPAVLLHVSATGKVIEEATLPSAHEQGEGIGRKGSAARISCPATNDCWLSTTQGWLFHLAPENERTLARDENESEYFQGLITFRPEDLGLPQVPADAPPPDTSGLVEEPPNYGGGFAESKTPAIEANITAPLLTHVHSRLVGGTTLELRFDLAVKARVRLLAKRRKKLVASTPTRTLAAGARKLLLRLNRHEWPTKLDLQTHPLAPLPTTTVKESVGGPEHGGVRSNTVSTGLTVLPRTPFLTGSGFRP